MFFSESKHLPKDNSEQNKKEEDQFEEEKPEQRLFANGKIGKGYI